MAKKRVLLSTPVRVDGEIFKEYLSYLRRLDLTGIDLDIHFIFNNCDFSAMLDWETCEFYGTDDQSYRVTETEHHWLRGNIVHMVEMRNRCIQKALLGGYDYLFFVDSDLLLPQNTLQKLVDDGKDIVAALFWTKGADGKYWSNAWDFDQCSTEPETQKKLATEPGVHKVGGSGACMLVSNRVLEAGVDYSPIYNLRGLMGEDRNFCIRAYCNGFEIFADNTIQPLHLYRMSEWEKYKAQKAAAVAAIKQAVQNEDRL